MSIRVFIQTDFFQGGPAIFRKRIIPLLNKCPDIEVVTNLNKKFDIELAFIRKVYKHNKSYLLRADGCYYEEDRKKLNKNIKEAILGAKYIIFQSKFSLELCDKILNIKEKIERKGIKHTIIYNGVDLNYIKKIKPNKEIEPGSFVTCAGWRPNKRPNSTIKGFLEADTKRHLYIIGGEGFSSRGHRVSKKYSSNYIHILDKLSNKEVISIMKACEYQLHLCHIDSCPNVAVEGLASGLNILCTNLGGTKELVKDNGVILGVDNLWETKYLKPMNLDNLKPKKVAEGIHKLLKIKTRSNRPDLDISLTVDKYVKIIRKLVNN